MTITAGTCTKCIEMQKTLVGYCCVLCAIGLKASDGTVVKDPFTGTVTIDLSDPMHTFWGKKGFYGNKKTV